VFFRPLWSLVLLLAGCNLSTGHLDDRVFEFFQCMSMPDSCTALNIDDYNKYYSLNKYNDPMYKMLLNNFDNLFSVNATVRLSQIRGLEIHNTMKEVKPSVFSSLKTLLHLNLANNLIEKVEKNAFVGLRKLRNLILSENLIESLPPEVFFFLTELQNVSLANNKMTVLNFDNFQFNSKLELLDVSSNKLTTLLASLDKLKRMKLKTLLLAHNNLTDISVLQQLPWLTSLNVSGNQLCDVEKVKFQAPTKIDILHNSLDCKSNSVINSPNINGIGYSGTPPPPIR
jgi:Leucine-rich repeat (LRR) protein